MVYATSKPPYMISDTHLFGNNWEGNFHGDQSLGLKERELNKKPQFMNNGEMKI